MTDYLNGPLPDYSTGGIASDSAGYAGDTTGGGGWLSQGTQFLGTLAGLYGTYTQNKRATDLEHQNYDAGGAGANLGRPSGVPGWAIGLGVLVAGVVVYRAVIK